MDPVSLQTIWDTRLYDRAISNETFINSLLDDKVKFIQSFPYPLLNLNGRLSTETTVLAGGFVKGDKNDSQVARPPYELHNSTILVLFPDTTKGYWDLRVSLSKLVQGLKQPMALMKELKSAIQTWLAQNEDDWRYEITMESNNLDVTKRHAKTLDSLDSKTLNTFRVGSLMNNGEGDPLDARRDKIRSGFPDDYTRYVYYPS